MPYLTKPQGSALSVIWMITFQLLGHLHLSHMLQHAIEVSVPTSFYLLFFNYTFGLRVVVLKFSSNTYLKMEEIYCCLLNQFMNSFLLQLSEFLHFLPQHLGKAVRTSILSSLVYLASIPKSKIIWQMVNSIKNAKSETGATLRFEKLFFYTLQNFKSELSVLLFTYEINYDPHTFSADMISNINPYFTMSWSFCSWHIWNSHSVMHQLLVLL